MSIQQLDVPTPEEVEMRAYVECYSEGQPSTELQYLIHALKIIDELRAENAQLEETSLTWLKEIIAKLGWIKQARFTA